MRREPAGRGLPACRELASSLEALSEACPGAVHCLGVRASIRAFTTRSGGALIHTRRQAA